ncbi:MAG: hypothetical protein V1925_01725 [Candidatus Omnitrophota bacterium]
MGIRRSGLTLFELIAALVFIGLFMGTMTVFIHKTAVIGKETVLRVQLKSIRSTINLHKMITGAYPGDLRELVQARYTPPGSSEVFFSETFLDSVGRDADSYPIDPFGKRFYYNGREGVVASAAKGYENW